MAENPGGALQRALIARLENDAEVAALVGDRIYDDPPPDVVMPYIRLGNIVVDPLRMDGHRDWDVAFAVEVHEDGERTAGRVHATSICAAIIAALDDQGDVLAVAGFVCEWCFLLTSTVTRSGDGKKYFGQVAFDAALSPA